MLEVSGLPWCREPKNVGLGSLTSHILCRTHNSALSPLDQAAQDAANARRRATSLLAERSKVRPHRWSVHHYKCDGPLLERWFLKTAINLAVVNPQHIGWSEGTSNNSNVPDLFVRAVLGLDVLPAPMGLYFAAAERDLVEADEAISFTARIGPTGVFIGAVFWFHGFRFLLHLTRDDPGLRLELPFLLPTSINVPGIADEQLTTETRIQFHLPRIKFKIGPYVSHYLEFKWPGN